MDEKEALRIKRKEAYQKAKAKRDADPRFKALKERLKEDRKAKYRAYRDAQKKIKREAKQKRIAEKDAALMTLVMRASDLEDGDRHQAIELKEKLSDDAMRPIRC